MRRLVLAVLAMTAGICVSAQTVGAFKKATDSLTVLLSERTSVLDNELKLQKIVKRGDLLDFHFDNSLGDYPWSDKDVEWFRSELKRQFPSAYSSCNVGKIYSKKTLLDDLATPRMSFDGKATPYALRSDDRDLSHPFVERIGAPTWSRGLSGRNIALWQSHGRYYDTKEEKWSWQRAPLFRTVEDMYTQSYVLPFLIPMLENAGAYVMTPRERDLNSYEVVCDNDPSFTSERPAGMRRRGSYRESGSWSSAGVGFADTKAVLMKDDNPFREGTARKAGTVAYGSEGLCEARWSFEVESRGIYAVYISYRTLEESTDAAHYTVQHMGGKTEYSVDQRMGGGTWIYLGSFEFGPDSPGAVTLDNVTPEGHAFVKGKVVTADAVRVGGGMGKVARGSDSLPHSEWTTSGLPAFAEGALYSMQWAGIDTCIVNQWEADYTRDYASRGAWTSMMSYGSKGNPLRTDPDAPKYEGKNIPIDLSFAFHTDAGTTPNDSTVGTLAIYTLLCDKADTLPSGMSRAVSRTYCDFVQTQICRDMRSLVDSSWNRRCIWDRSYSESRTTSTPSMLLEFLSHQNFADMRYGLDPRVRFITCRAVYKGMLKFLSELYGHPYTVQPLPVHALAVTFGDTRTKAVVSWLPTEDPLEPTAAPEGYIVYTRVDDGAFDDGRQVRALEGAGGRVRFTTDIKPGHMYSFKVVACNDGGMSFPSETLCLGVPGVPQNQTVMLVSNFDRVSAPAWFDGPSYAGFDGGLDSGVGYMSDIWYIGEDYNHRRDMEWITNDNPGFGATRDDKAGLIVAGNTFDYASVHGKALLAAGYSFFSVSRDAWISDHNLSSGSRTVDLICGKQVTVRLGTGQSEDRFKVFPAGLQQAIKAYTAAGGNMIVSGANIATDVWDRVYPVSTDSLARVSDKAFVTGTLGYSWASSFGTDSGHVVPSRNPAIKVTAGTSLMEFRQEMNAEMYCVENPDGIKPAGKNSSELLLYPDTRVCAAVLYSPGKYKAVSFGFPLETLTDPYDLQKVLDNTLKALR